MSYGLADRRKEVQLLRDQLLGVNDPFELLAEVIADNNRLRRIIDTCDCHKGKP
tara:strand:+ start:409 stop:570 length:162 start_codon:yes stop_codon:yes gene_type:complete